MFKNKVINSILLAAVLMLTPHYALSMDAEGSGPVGQFLRKDPFQEILELRRVVIEEHANARVPEEEIVKNHGVSDRASEVLDRLVQRRDPWAVFYRSYLELIYLKVRLNCFADEVIYENLINRQKSFPSLLANFIKAIPSRTLLETRDSIIAGMVAYNERQMNENGECFKLTNRPLDESGPWYEQPIMRPDQRFDCTVALDAVVLHYINRPNLCEPSQSEFDSVLNLAWFLADRKDGTRFNFFNLFSGDNTHAYQACSLLNNITRKYIYLNISIAMNVYGLMINPKIWQKATPEYLSNFYEFVLDLRRPGRRPAIILLGLRKAKRGTLTIFPTDIVNLIAKTLFYANTPPLSGG